MSSHRARIRGTRSLRRLGALVVCVCAVLGLPRADPADDGIALTLASGPGAGQVLLQWSGGQVTYEVFRATAPGTVVSPDHKLGETDAGQWTDDPPAGLIFYYVVTGGLDRVPPTIVARPIPPANVAGWNRADLQVTFTCNDAGSGIASCPASVAIGSEGAGQPVGGTATDLAGNSASTTLTVNLDKTPPALSVVSPIGTITGNAAPTIALSYSDVLSGIDTATLRVSIDGVPLSGCSAGPTSATCLSPGLAAGPHQVAASVTDVAGNSTSLGQGFSLFLATPLEIQITSPSQGLLTHATSLAVTGTVSSRAEMVLVNGVAAVVQGGIFTASPVPLIEGRNTITAVATNSAGDAGTSSLVVERDTSPPTVVVESPAMDQIVTGPTATLVGLVDDVVTGTVSAGNCQVTISGRAGSATATVASRTFLVPDFPLVPGPNIVTATATDAAGNVGVPFQLRVTRRDLAGQTLGVLSGDAQTGAVGSPLASPFVVQLTSAAGLPVPGRLVTFRVSRGDGSLAGGGSAGRSVNVTSDSSGRAQALLTLGSRAGLGNQRVVASSPGFAEQVEFIASATASDAVAIEPFDLDPMRTVAGRPLPKSLVVFVHDATGNPVSGVPVTFSVVAGGGGFGGNPTAVVATDDDGRAQALPTLGPDPGINNNVFEAALPEPAATPVTFVATGLAIGPGSATRVSGVVLDNSNVPMPGVTMRIPGTGLTATTDDQGRFSIPNAPVATITLEADGTTATRPGVWPMLHFVLTTISGQDNSLGMPIYLLPIDTASGQVAGGPQDVTLSMKDVPGIALTVFANSVTCPDGSHQCLVSISQVHDDKVPMAPLQGAAPRLIWTIQPAGTRFDPPARISYPNVDGLPPGGVTEVFSFDHDLGQYVSIGTATVSEDGSTITSDPGAGIRHAGWGYPRPFPRPLSTLYSCQNGDICEGLIVLTRGGCLPVPHSMPPLCTPCDPTGRVCDGEGTCVLGKDITDKILDRVSVVYNNPQPAPPAQDGSCVAGTRFDMPGLTTTCDAVDLVGSVISEKLTTITNTCGTGDVHPGPGCTVGANNTLIGHTGTVGSAVSCHDTYGVKVLPTTPLFSCTSFFLQTMLLNGLPIESHIITVRAAGDGHVCFGSADRN